MAAPQVAGVAALIMGQNPELTSEEIIARLKNNVVKSNKLECVCQQKFDPFAN
jgi:subtilisin family serine protease